MFKEPLLTRKWPTWARYGLTTLLVLSALAVKLWLWPYFAGYPFLFFYLCIIASAALFDHGSGILSVVLSAAVADYFFVAPRYSVMIEGSENTLAWVLFAVVGLIIATVIEAMHVAVQRLQEVNGELAAANRAKDLLMREAAHRVSNDLQILGALVDIQMRTTDEPTARAALASTANRIRLLGRVQQRLRLSKTIAVVDTHEFLEELCKDLQETLIGTRPIALRLDIERHDLPQQRALAVGLIINELLTNALKYGFPDERTGIVNVDFSRHEDEFRLSVRDNGIGIATRAGAVGGTGFGHRLLRSMAAQLGGRSEINSNACAGGTVASVHFPVDPRSDASK